MVCFLCHLYIIPSLRSVMTSLTDWVSTPLLRMLFFFTS